MTDINTPAWAQGLTPEPSAKPKRAVKTPATPAAPRTDSERIAAAREVSIAWSKSSNPPGGAWGFGYDDSHYESFAGDQSSAWDAMHLELFARILETPILQRSRYVWQLGHYAPRAGQFNLDGGVVVTLAELKAAVAERILELGISEVLLQEWFSGPHPDDDGDYGRAIWREALDVRINRWRVAAGEVSS